MDDLLRLVIGRRIDSTTALDDHIAAELDRVGAPSAVWRLPGCTAEMPDPYRAGLLLGKAAGGQTLDASERASLAAEGAYLLGGALARRGMRWQLFLDPARNAGENSPVIALFETLIAKKRLPDTVLCLSDPAAVTALLPLFARTASPRFFCALDGTMPASLGDALTAALTAAPGAFLGIAGDAPDFLACPMIALYEKRLSALLRGRALSFVPPLSPAEAAVLLIDFAPTVEGRLCRFLLGRESSLTSSK